MAHCGWHQEIHLLTNRTWPSCCPDTTRRAIRVAVKQQGPDVERVRDEIRKQALAQIEQERLAKIAAGCVR
jgi:hypothetical protein